MKTTLNLLIALMTGIAACRKPPAIEDKLPFKDIPVSSPVAAGVIDEASGIADSKVNAGFLWVIQDSQQPTALYLLNHTGQHGKKVFIKNVTNRDWEELALSDGNLYIGETGDNNLSYSNYIIYRLAEPNASTDTVTQVDKIQFSYPDGPHDAEAFFVDAATKDIYIITKRDAQSKVYKLAYPQSTTTMNTASFVTALNYTGVTAAAISFQKEILVKTYSEIYYYLSLQEFLSNTATVIPYQVEPQGEAITFSIDNTGFYTLSEKAFAPSVTLNFYSRR